MILLTVVLFLLMLGGAVLYGLFKISILYTLTVTFGVTFYHFIMRLAVGTVFDKIFHNRIDYTKKWFQEKPFEKGLYRFLKVHAWKRFLPTFSPETFDAKTKTVEELLGATCQAELVHETIAVLSFAPIPLFLVFGSLPAFLITSFCAAGIDLIFVILQRYNRPRLLKLKMRKLSKIIRTRF